MAKAKKIEKAPIHTEVVAPHVESIAPEKKPEVVKEIKPVIEIPKVFIPDTPAQMIEPVKQDISVPEQLKGENEIQFLQRILFIQEDGGFGRHLHTLIKERIKSLS